METQKIVNLISDTDNESSKFATKKYYVIHDQNCMNYSEENKNGTSIKFETKTVNSILCNIFIFKSDAYVLVKGDTLATVGIAKTSVALKKCTSITNYATHIIVNIMMMLKILTLQCLCTI